MRANSPERWAGHVSRTEIHRLPKIVLYNELSTGHRDRGAPKKRFKDPLKKYLPACHIDHRQWSALAADREAWDTPFISQSPPLRTTAERPLKRSAAGGRTASSQHQPQTHHTSAAAVAECACHVLALSATSEPAPDVANSLNLRLRSQAKQKFPQLNQS